MECLSQLSEQLIALILHLTVMMGYKTDDGSISFHYCNGFLVILRKDKCQLIITARKNIMQAVFQPYYWNGYRIYWDENLTTEFVGEELEKVKTILRVMQISTIKVED